jgi:hypothetical protein
MPVSLTDLTTMHTVDGPYRKARLIEKYGTDVPRPDLLHRIASDCSKMDALGNDPCGAHYRDL